jgi:hypothetical protein
MFHAACGVKSGAKLARSRLRVMDRKHRAEMMVAVGAVIVLTALSLSASTAQNTVRTWPDVQSLEQAFAISDPSKAVVRTFVCDQKNAPIYLFVCRTGDDERVANVNYAGDLDAG